MQLRYIRKARELSDPSQWLSRMLLSRAFPTFSLILFALVLHGQPTDHLIEADSLDRFTEQELDSVGASHGIDAQNPVTFYRIRYETRMPEGDWDTATGAFLVPDTDSCDEFPLLSYQHGTAMKDTKVPSNPSGNRLTGLFFAQDAYLVTMADYVGLGGNEGLHPYHHWETEATASLHLMRAAREFINDSLSVNSNGEVFMTGYSQGGHATMALHRYIESNGLLNEFDVQASAPLSGAYNLSGVQARQPADSLYTMPAYYPYIIESFQRVYGNLYNNREEIYEAPYDSLTPIYLSGDSSLGDFNSILPNNLYYFMEDSVLDSFYADTANFSHRLRVALAKNDLHDWAPQRPVHMAYCGSDAQVYPDNARVARDSMQANGASDVLAIEVADSLDHGDCAFPALLATKNWFDGLRSSCLSASLKEASTRSFIELSPVPARRKFELSTPFAEGFRYRVLSLRGKLLRSGKSKGATCSAPCDGMDEGFYLIVIEKGKQRYTKRLLVSGP